VLALEELTPQAAGIYEKALAKAYPYHTLVGTVGLWSRPPLSDTRPIDVIDYGPLADTRPADHDLAWDRALSATVATDHGPLTVYVAHLGSVRVNPKAGFWTASRDIGAQMQSAQNVAGDGFGFTWPASFPVVRIDQILVRGVKPDSSWVLPANGSDHRPVEARISW
jgi:vancomycin resistance protein VanJ